MASACFVLSDEEKAVGVSAVDAGRITFSEPITLATAGASPVAMCYLESGGHPTLAVVAKDKRDYALELQQPHTGEKAPTLALKDIKRDPRRHPALRCGPRRDPRPAPAHARRVDDHGPLREQGDSATKPRSRPVQMLSKDAMPQFGLVQAAGPDNTALLDVDGDGKEELLIADANYVRFCSYDAKKGWRVVDQVNVPDSSTQLSGVALLGAERRPPHCRGRQGQWSPAALRPQRGQALGPPREDPGPGFPLGAIRAGSFAGDGQPSILCLSG
jgi:hypothetical protein